MSNPRMNGAIRQWMKSMADWSKTIIQLMILILLTTGCAAGFGKNSAAQPSGNSSQTTENNETAETLESGDVDMEHLTMDSFLMENRKTVYFYAPQSVKENTGEKVPLVLFMCGTTCDPVDNAMQSGWLSQAEKENFIVVSPDYNNYATYSETDFLVSVVEYMLQNYPVDPERIYSTGFSNGGAASVALTRDYPEYFAAISAMGWMIGMDNKNGVYETYDMPFQVVQGDGEYTEKTQSGAMAVMDDEKDGIRAMMLYNEMIEPDLEADYDRTPYWGYEPDETKTLDFAGQGWEISNYYKEGFSSAFAQLVLVEDSQHRPRQPEAEVAWNFFKAFRRDQNGKIVENISRAE